MVTTSILFKLTRKISEFWGGILANTNCTPNAVLSFSLPSKRHSGRHLIDTHSDQEWVDCSFAHGSLILFLCYDGHLTITIM